jgi:hypothetical protein
MYFVWERLNYYILTGRRKLLFICKKFHQKEQNESLKIRKTMINGIGNPVHGLGQAQHGGGVKPVNRP